MLTGQEPLLISPESAGAREEVLWLAYSNGNAYDAVFDIPEAAEVDVPAEIGIENTMKVSAIIKQGE